MNLLTFIQEKKISKSALARQSGVPWATLSDLCSGKSRMEQASVMTVYKLARALDVTVEELIADAITPDVPRADFVLFKSEICHRVRSMGDISFLIDVFQSDDIRDHYRRGNYAEAFYLLGMADYLCGRNALPICADFDDLRCKKLKRPLYPSAAWAPYVLRGDTTQLKRCKAEAIPEFRRFNIMEAEIDNVI